MKVLIVGIFALFAMFEKASAQTQPTAIEYTGDYVACDTCRTTIVVSHLECTDCTDINVEKGVVYVPSDVLRKAEGLVIPLKDTTGPLAFARNRISPQDLYLADSLLFARLWPIPQSFNRRYRLTGQVVDVKRRLNSAGYEAPYPSLYFRVDKVKRLKNLKW